jgi:hypothetical protein
MVRAMASRRAQWRNEDLGIVTIDPLRVMFLTLRLWMKF